MVRKPFLTEHFLFCHTFRILRDRWRGGEQYEFSKSGHRRTWTRTPPPATPPHTRRSSCRGCRCARCRAPCSPAAGAGCRPRSGAAASPGRGRERGVRPGQTPVSQRAVHTGNGRPENRLFNWEKLPLLATPKRGHRFHVPGLLNATRPPGWGRKGQEPGSHAGPEGGVGSCKALRSYEPQVPGDGKKLPAEQMQPFPAKQANKTEQKQTNKSQHPASCARQDPLGPLPQFPPWKTTPSKGQRGSS